MFGSVIEPVEERQRIFETLRPRVPIEGPSAILPGNTAPASTDHGAAGASGTAVQRWSRQRHPARREARHPDRFERVLLRAAATPRTPVTARNSVSTTLRKSRGAKRSVGVDDVGLAPADELLADVDREPAVAERGRSAAGADSARALDAAVARRRAASSSSTWSCELRAQVERRPRTASTARA